MRKSAFVANLVAAALIGSVAYAATKQQPQQPSDKNPRYFNLNGYLGENDHADAFLKEIRQGARVTSAVLDVCYPVSVVSNRKDRFELALKVEGNNLTGNGQTQIDKLPVSAQLTRKAKGNAVSFAGTIRIAAIEVKVDAQELEDMSESDFRGQPEEVAIEAAPPNFNETSPGLVGVRVERKSFTALVKSLKSENVKLSLDDLLADCSALRTDQQILLVTVDPERAPALMNKVKAMPGVSLVGYARGVYENDKAVRLSTRRWLAGGRFDKEKLASEIAASIAKALSATTESTNFDRATGELGLKFKRPNDTFKEFGLTDSIELTVLIGPEKIGSNDAVVVWFGDSQLTTTDQGSEPRLNLEQAKEGDELPPDSIDVASLVVTLARDLGGKVWDSDNLVWNDP